MQADPANAAPYAPPSSSTLEQQPARSTGYLRRWGLGTLWAWVVNGAAMLVMDGDGQFLSTVLIAGSVLAVVCVAAAAIAAALAKRDLPVVLLSQILGLMLLEAVSLM